MTVVELKELTIQDGTDIYDMLQEIGPGESGFANSGYGVPAERFKAYLKKYWRMSHGINLPPQYVPQTIYWLFVNGRPVGYGKLRKYLNDALRERGGHIGYVIRPSERGKGYGTLLLRELLGKAGEKGLLEVLITVDEDNARSRKVAEANGGQLTELKDGICKYWIRKLQKVESP